MIMPLPVQQSGEVAPVAAFKGLQVTGVSVSRDGRLFACFPRWRPGVPLSVAEVREDGSYRPYPDYATNQWEIGDAADRDRFICVQSVIAHGPRLYVIDSKNPMMRKAVSTPTLYVYDLRTDRLTQVYELSASTSEDSYVNDLRVDSGTGMVYLTDSNVPGLIVLDLETGRNYRVLDRHPFTTAEFDSLVIDGKRHDGAVHSDGIELDTRRGILYFHALKGRTLYGIPVPRIIEDAVDDGDVFRMDTPVTDGMAIDRAGNLYLGDLEHNGIVYVTPDRREVRELASGEGISWPDTFSVYGGYLYFSNSRIHEVSGDIADMTFTIDKVGLPHQSDCAQGFW